MFFPWTPSTVTPFIAGKKKSFGAKEGRDSAVQGWKGVINASASPAPRVGPWRVTPLHPYFPPGLCELVRSAGDTAIGVADELDERVVAGIDFPLPLL